HITLQQLRPLPPLVRPRSGQQHPQVLDARAGRTVIEIHKGRALLVPQQIAQMTVAVNAYLPQWARSLECLVDTFQQCFTRLDVAIAQDIRQQRAGQHLVARIDAQTLDTKPRAAPEGAQGTNLMHTRETPPE